jgi:hypothetical protein
MAKPMIILGSDWGFDELFCNSLQVYNKMSYNLTTTSAKVLLSSEFNGCRIVFGSSIGYVHHLDDNELTKLSGGYSIRKRRSNQMRNLIKREFKVFFLPGDHLMKKRLSHGMFSIYRFLKS